MVIISSSLRFLDNNWNWFLGFRQRQPGDTVLIEYERLDDGRVFPKSAESVKDDPGEEDGPYEIP